ncbi:MAG: BACON domain-containing protein [Candidatus Cryptobacteroides sp.]
MKINKIVRFLAASLFAAGLLSACVQTKEPAPSTIVGAETATLTFEAQGSETQILPVYSDGLWTVECDAEWITLDCLSGNGNVDIAVSVTDNVVDGELDFPREASILLKAGLQNTGQNFTVTVFQKGNKYKGVKDITVTEALALEDNRVAQIPVSTVVAVGKDAFVISDGTSNIIVFGTVEAEIKVGDTVKLTGDRVSTYGIPAINLDTELFEITATGAEVKYPEPKALSDLDEYNGASSEYLAVSGSLVGSQMRFADKEKRLDLVLLTQDLAALNLHKIVAYGYYVGVYEKNPALLITGITDIELDESLIPYPVVWANGAGAKAAGVLNYTTDSWAAKNALESIKGFGTISYIPACDPPLDFLAEWDASVEQGSLVDNGNDKFKRDISGDNPRITGAWPGDFWLIKGDGAIKAGSKVQVKFESRVSATNPKFWQLEFYDGDHWKVAGDVYETDETGSAITYTHQMASDGSTNIQINTTVTYNHNTEHCWFRFRCMANWQANGQGPLAARNGGTARLSVTDTGEGGVEWWPSITIVEEGDGEDRPDVDPVMANIICNPEYLAFEGKPDGAKKITVTSDYDFTIEPSVDWLHIDVTSGLAGEKTEIMVSCDESVSSNLREGKLVIASADSKHSVPVIQSAAGQEVDPMISIDGNSKSVNYKGQTVKVNVQTTIEYTVSSDVDWISLTPETKTLIQKDEVTLYILENASETDTRTGHVTFGNEQLGLQTVLTVEQGVHPGVPAIFEDDFSWLAPFNAQYADTAGKKIGDTVGSNGSDANAPNVYTTAPFNTPEFAAAFADKGYVDLYPATQVVYAQDEYLKFGKTGSNNNTGLELNLGKYIEGTQNVDLSFDFCMMVQGSGTVDAGPVTVLIIGDGTFANGSKRADFTSTQEATQYFWNKAKATLLGVTSGTKLHILNGRVIQEDGTYNFTSTSGAGRFFLDNILVVPGESPIVFEETFDWMAPLIEQIDEVKGKACSDFIYGTYADMATRIKYSNDNSFNIQSEYDKLPGNTTGSWEAYLKEIGYSHLHTTWCMYLQGTVENPYMKFCKGNNQDGLAFQPFTKSYDELTISFDWASHQTATALDEVHMQVVIEGDGEFENGTKTSDPADQLRTEVDSEPVFTHSSFVLKNVNASTVIKICCKEGFDANFTASGQHRYYIDNIVISK